MHSNFSGEAHHPHMPPPDPEEMKRAMLVFYLVLLSMFGFQSALVYWRRRHKRSYELVTLLGLWVVPPAIALHAGFWRFLATWAIYSGITGYILFQCTFRKMNKSLPRRVYAWFFGVFKVSIAVGASGYILLLAQIMGLGLLLGTNGLLGPATAIILLWYGLYFGVLARDSAEIASDRIANQLGTARRMAVSVRDCGICGGELPDAHGPAGSSGTSGGAQQRSVQLSCKHLFHDECIRGWTIVGKKDTCPTCWEKVDLRSLYADRPWETTNLSWIQMLDMVRYLVVWNPLILVGLHFLLHWAHLDKPLHPHAVGGLNATMANGTLGGPGNLTRALNDTAELVMAVGSA